MNEKKPRRRDAPRSVAEMPEEKLRTMLYSLGRYAGVPPSSQDFFQRDYFDVMPAPGGTPLIYPLVDFRIGRGRVLDLTTIRFRVAHYLGGPMTAMADDLATFVWLRWRIKINGRNPMDQGATPTANNQPKPPAGYFVLNRNVLGESDDMPVHLIVREGQNFTVEAVIAPSAPVVPPEIGVELKGRWLTQKQFNDLMKERLP